MACNKCKCVTFKHSSLLVKPTNFSSVKFWTNLMSDWVDRALIISKDISCLQWVPGFQAHWKARGWWSCSRKKLFIFRFGQISNGDQASNNKAGTKKLLETNFLGNQSVRQTVQLLTTQLDFVHLATVEIHLVVEHLILLLELLVVVAHLHDKAANFDLLVQWQSQLDVKEWFSKCYLERGLDPILN